MKEIKNVFKVFGMVEEAMWEEEMPYHRDCISVALVPKWRMKRICSTCNYISSFTVISHEDASHTKSRTAKKYLFFFGAVQAGLNCVDINIYICTKYYFALN